MNKKLVTLNEKMKMGAILFLEDSKILSQKLTFGEMENLICYPKVILKKQIKSGWRILIKSSRFFV